MFSLHLMQLITQRLVKTFQDMHEAISCQVQKMHRVTDPPADSSRLQQTTQANSQHQAIVQPCAAKQNTSQQNNEKKIQETPPQKAIKKYKKNSNLQRPKRPLSSFKLFLSEMKNKGGNKEDAESQNLVTKIATKKWQSMSNQERRPYQQLQQKELQEYEKNLCQYYSDNPEEKLKDLQKQEIKEEKKKQKLIERRQQKVKQKQKNKNRELQRNQDNASANISSEHRRKEKLKTQSEGNKRVLKSEIGQRKVPCQEPGGNSLKRESDIDEELESIIRISRQQSYEQNFVEGRVEDKEEAESSQKMSCRPISQQGNKRGIDQFLNLDQLSDSLGDDF